MEVEEDRKKEEFRSVVNLHVKTALLQDDLKITELMQRLNEQFRRSDTVQNLSNKLKRGTLKYIEALENAEILGYDINWTKKKS